MTMYSLRLIRRIRLKMNTNKRRTVKKDKHLLDNTVEIGPIVPSMKLSMNHRHHQVRMRIFRLFKIELPSHAIIIIIIPITIIINSNQVVVVIIVEEVVMALADHFTINSQINIIRDRHHIKQAIPINIIILVNNINNNNKHLVTLDND